jgi:soluble lytic murein transglycosylase-like protein
VTDSKDIFSLTEQFANEYHVDAEKLRSIAKCESGFNPDAAYLDYAGLYQFSPATWASYRVQMAKDTNPDLRFNPAASIQTAAFVLSIGRESIWPNCLD